MNLGPSRYAVRGPEAVGAARRRMLFAVRPAMG